jgi:hypothetical protein
VVIGKNVSVVSPWPKWIKFPQGITWSNFPWGTTCRMFDKEVQRSNVVQIKHFYTIGEFSKHKYLK